MVALRSKFFVRLGNEPAVLVSVCSTQGSVPREVGAWMAVFRSMTLGTVGGGHLEWEAIALARERLDQDACEVQTRRFALGPSLGQCCGGVVWLEFRRVTASDIGQLRQQLTQVHRPVALFGGGHVGHALVQVLGHLPVDLVWIDSRDNVFGADVPSSVQCVHSDPVQAEVASVAPDALIVVMSFSHAEDLEVVAACLQRQRVRNDLPYIGLIGSQSKWATFRHRLAERGFTQTELDHVTCPIGVIGITDKRPEVIAVSIAAQLLQVR
jgi:xanthine dehydrogenase accessory factor